MSKKNDKTTKFWEKLKEKYGESISTQNLMMEIGQNFSGSPSAIRSHIWLMSNLGLIRKSKVTRFAYDIAKKGVGESE